MRKTKEVRIKVLNKQSDGLPLDAIYVGRPTIFGNPYRIGKDGTRDEVIAKFEKYFHDRIASEPDFQKAVDGLKGAAALVCWCAPNRCHADVIVQYLEGRSNGPPVVVISGARDYQNKTAIRKRLKALPPNTIIITGAASGADTLADEVAKELGLDRIILPANWNRHGKPAGPIRNRRMLDLAALLGTPQLIAFHYDMSISRGTKDCYREAERRGMPTELIP